MQKDKEHKVIRNILSKTEIKAPADMTDLILLALKKEVKPQSVYRPLIPSWFWYSSSIAVLCFLFWVLTQTTLAQVGSVFTPYLQYASELFSIDRFEIGRIQVYSISALGTMLYLSAFLLNLNQKSSIN